eukprot:1158482-Prorocentrum_minimum.AAC.2
MAAGCTPGGLGLGMFAWCVGAGGMRPGRACVELFLPILPLFLGCEIIKHWSTHPSLRLLRAIFTVVTLILSRGEGTHAPFGIWGAVDGFVVDRSPPPTKAEMTDLVGSVLLAPVESSCPSCFGLNKSWVL